MSPFPVDCVLNLVKKTRCQDSGSASRIATVYEALKPRFLAGRLKRPMVLIPRQPLSFKN
jgi:hypothetical protein